MFPILTSGQKTGKNVLSTLIWHVGVCLTALVPAAYWVPEWRAAILNLVILLILYPLVAYTYFAIRDPKLLQTEKFQIDDKRLDRVPLLGDETTKGPMIEGERAVRNPHISDTVAEVEEGNR